MSTTRSQNASPWKGWTEHSGTGMRHKGILLNGTERADACHHWRRPSIPWAALTNGLISSTIGGSATVPRMPGDCTRRGDRHPVSGLTSREPFTYRANREREHASTKQTSLGCGGSFRLVVPVRRHQRVRCRPFLRAASDRLAALKPRSHKTAALCILSCGVASSQWHRRVYDRRALFRKLY